MQVDFAFLADSAEVNNGKLYVLGGSIDTIYGLQAPLVHPQLAIAVRLLASPGELDRDHIMEVKILDADGRSLHQTQAHFRIGRPANAVPGWPVPSLFVMNLVQFRFEQFGHYTFDFLVNGSSLKTLPFRVVQRAA